MCSMVFNHLQDDFMEYYNKYNAVAILIFLLEILYQVFCGFSLNYNNSIYVGSIYLVLLLPYCTLLNHLCTLGGIELKIKS